MTLKQALSKISNISRGKIKNMECAHQLKDDMLISNLDADAELSNCVAKENCRVIDQRIFN